MNAVMNPTANGRSVTARILAISAWIQSGPRHGCTPPKDPSPPAADTAPARVPPEWKAIGAETIGWAIPRSSVNRVRSIL